MNWTVYRAFCRVSKKSYIGITSMRLERRWSAHVSAGNRGKSKAPFHCAIRKYGAQAFDLAVLETHSSQADVVAAEIRLIAERNTLTPHGYNRASGGEGAPCVGTKWTQERRAKMVLALTGRKIPPEIVERVAAKLRGRKLPEYHAAILRIAGRKNKGRKHSPEQILQHRLMLRIASIERAVAASVGCSLSNGRFRARLYRNRRYFDVGTFDTLEEAQAAWRVAALAHVEELRCGVPNQMFDVDIKSRRAANLSERWAHPPTRARWESALRRHQYAPVFPKATDS